jgi:hypothetical protein
MKKFLVLVLFACLPVLSNPIGSDCSFNGKKLYGRVRIVNAGEDVKVRIVNAGENLRVEFSSIEYSQCGRWFFSQSGENVKIRFVEAGEDITVRVHPNNPGL